MRAASGKLVMVLLSLNAAALLAVLAMLLSGSQWLPSAIAQIPAPAAEANSPYLLAPGQFAANVWGCYVLDTRTQTLCAYVYQPGEKILRLQAARGISQDLQLQSFNTDPAPAEVAKLLQKQSELKTGPRMPAAPDEPEKK